jgi:hypothetical protein
VGANHGSEYHVPFTALSATYGPRGPVAVVATHPVLFGMARVYAALRDMAAGDVGVFYGIATAEQWLNEQKPT